MGSSFPGRSGAVESVDSMMAEGTVATGGAAMLTATTPSMVNNSIGLSNVRIVDASAVLYLSTPHGSAWQMSHEDDPGDGRKAAIRQQAVAPSTDYSSLIVTKRNAEKDNKEAVFWSITTVGAYIRSRDQDGKKKSSWRGWVSQ